jgi:deazaflavin-dependent oxidoreductase (nitroreductase family)
MAHTKLKNWIPATILRSPLHRLMSNRTLLLSYNGRRTDRPYSTPINYHQAADTMLIATDSGWWHNFETPGPAFARVRGANIRVTAQVVGDADDAADALAAIVRAQPSYGRWAHVRVEDGEPNSDDVRQEIARGRHVIRLHTES